jgi:hypothetical protein
MPKMIIDNNNLDPYEKILYQKLYLLTKLSAANKWIDSNDSIYTHLSITKAAELLHCCRNKADKTFKSLASKNLIEIIDAGKHKVDKIYLLIPT